MAEELNPVASKKLDLLKSLFTKSADYPQREINIAFNRAYGHGLAFRTIRALRQAFSKGKFDDQAPAHFKMLEDNLMKKRARAARSAARGKAPRIGKIRGERRGRGPGRPPGRRKIDRSAVVFDDAANYLVLAFVDGGVEDHRFKSKLDAKDCIASLVQGGVAPNRIAYYERVNVDYSVSVNI